MLSGMYQVFRFFLGVVSVNRVKEMEEEMIQAFERIPYPEVVRVICDNTGFLLDEIKKNKKLPV